MKTLVCVLSVAAAVTGVAPDATAAPPVPHNVRVSDDDRAGSFVRHDGGTDPTLARCSLGRRPQNEAGVAIDPSRPDVIVVGGQTACPTLTMPVGYFDLGWAGIYRSIDGGRTWGASLVPGYPGDDSEAGRASPMRGMIATAEHALDFDADGRLFYAHIACSRPKQSSCRHFVSVYEQHAARHVRTVGLSTTSPPPRSGVEEGFGHWTSVAVDRSGGPHHGTAYVVWVAFRVYGQAGDAPEAAAPVSVPMMSRSTDHGRTWSVPAPVMAPLGVPYSSDVTVGPDGRVYVAVRNIGQTGPLEEISTATGGTDAVTMAASGDGGRSFGAMVVVDRIRGFDMSRYATGTRAENPGVCGDGYFACDSPYTAQDDRSNAAVVADEAGVHVLWNARRADGQSKVFVRSSPDGRSFPQPSRTLDDVPVGHQDRVEAAADGGVITATFMDSRADPSYHPDRPQGNTADGRTVAPYMDLWAAQSADGGRTWRERRVSSVTTNANLEVHEAGRVAFNGDYTGVAAVAGRIYAVWTDNRDVVTGIDARNPGDRDGNDTHLPCRWAPLDEDVRAYDSPTPADPCYSQGGLDQNLYGARLDERGRGNPHGP